MNDTKKQIVELASLRGFAAIVVAMSHALFLYHTPGWFTRCCLIFNGRAAVVIFFILSGFVLTRSLGNQAITFSSLVGFYIKRFFRIYPTIWAASTLGIVYLFWVNFNIHSPEASQFCQARFRPEHYDKTYILSSFAGVSAYILPPLWSIYVELSASLLMPLIAFVAYRRKRFFFAATLLALATSFALHSLTYYSAGLYLVDFYFGAGLAVLPARLRTLIVAPNFPTRAVALAATSGLIVSRCMIPDQMNPFGALYEAILAMVLISLLVYSNVRFSLLRAPWALYLGEISYSLYLIHFSVACFAMKSLDALESAGILTLPIICKAVIVAGTTLVVSWPLAHLCHQYVEKPGIELGRWVEQRFRAWAWAGAGEKAKPFQGLPTPIQPSLPETTE